MALFGSKKDADEWFKFRDAEDKLKFRNADKPAESLGRKLVKEQQKRRAAEKDAARWKEKYLKTKEELDKELESADIHPTGS